MLGAASGEEPLLLGSPGNGNFCIVSGFAVPAGLLPHGSGCGATVQGAVLLGGVFGVLCATHQTAPDATHKPATATTPRCLRMAIVFCSSLDASLAHCVSFLAQRIHIGRLL